MINVFFEILSPLPLNRHQDARKLFQLWAENAFNFLPNRWGLYEPIRHHFSMSSLDEAIRTWELYFLVKRTASPKLEGRISMQYGPHRSHSAWKISLNNVKDFDQPAFCKLLECSAPAFSADFGFIHRITEAEISRGRANGSIAFLDIDQTETNLYVTTRILSKCVPDVYWTTVFGRPYVELFSRERLLSCPAHRIKELDNGAIVIQLTPELKDIAIEEAAFERARQDARNHLDNDAIFDPAKGMEYPYRVPEFVWGPILQ
ncbi:MAG TPA: hypothetical protein VK681_33145 [Reyranella sp.]|nr:hypothetical protein [Terriglobales bacterium]HTG24916.1 hypothetical protein [Reyranella sp.]